jgi:hypothetical protein
MRDNKSLIDLFEDNELNVSRLYRVYSKRFPADEPFWKRLSAEEITHAGQIRTLRTLSGLKLVENNFTRGIVNYVIDFVKKEIEKAEVGAISDIEAVNVALRIEQSILEKKYFDFFQDTDKTLDEVMGKLGRETEIHLKMLQKMAKRLENKAGAKVLN